MPLTAKHAQLLKSNRALLLTFENFPIAGKLSAVALALVLGVYGGINALKGTASDIMQVCIRTKQSLQCADKTGKPYLMTQYYAQEWKANGVPGEVVFRKTIPATNPHKALWMALAAGSFSVAGVGLRSLQESERQLANYEAIAEKRDLAKGQLNARTELLEDYLSMAVKEVQVQGEIEAAANDCAVILKQCEVLGDADIRISQMEAEEAIFEAEVAGLPEDKKREYIDFLRKQKTPFLLTGTQTLDSISYPGDKVDDATTAAIEPKSTSKKYAYIRGFLSSTCLVWGNQGGGKSWIVRYFVVEKLKLGYRVIVFDPNSNQASWQGVELYNTYTAIERMMRWYVEEVERRYEEFCASTISEEEWREQLWRDGLAVSVIAEETTTYADFIKDEELLARFFRCGGTLSRKPEMPLTIVAHNNTQWCLGNVKGLGNLIRRMQQIQLLATTDETGETSQPVASGRALIKMDGSDEWVEVEVPKVDTKITDFRPFKQSRQTSEKTPESSSEYRDRMWKLEFDLGEKKPSDSQAADSKLSDSEIRSGELDPLSDKVSGFVWTVRAFGQMYPNQAPEQLFLSVSEAARLGQKPRDIIRSILKCGEKNEHSTRSYSRHGKTLLKWLIENYDDGEIAAFPEIKKFLSAE